MADPTTVLPSINITSHPAAAVSSLPTTSEPATPLSDSPLSGLDFGLQQWLEGLASNPSVYAKLLVSNAAAGSIIGKAGSTINDFQARTFARVQLSKSYEYFPGTTDRTVLVAGRLKQVVAAINLILAKLLREGVAPLSPRSKAAAPFYKPPSVYGSEDEAGLAGSASGAPHLLVRLLVPQPLCGGVIGKHGATIRQYATETDTVIRVTSNEASQTPASHRVVTIAGELEGVLKAVALMVLKQSDDPKFAVYGELPTPAISLLQPQPAGDLLGQQATPSLGPMHFLPGMVNPAAAAAVAGHLYGAAGFGAHPAMAGSDALGPAMAVDQYTQWLVGQRLAAAAAASYQMGGTTYYLPANSQATAVPSPGTAFMPAMWQPSMLGPLQQQQQHPLSMAAPLMLLKQYDE